MPFAPTVKWGSRGQQAIKPTIMVCSAWGKDLLWLPGSLIGLSGLITYATAYLVAGIFQEKHIIEKTGRHEFISSALIIWTVVIRIVCIFHWKNWLDATLRLVWESIKMLVEKCSWIWLVFTGNSGYHKVLIITIKYYVIPTEENNHCCLFMASTPGICIKHQQ